MPTSRTALVDTSLLIELQKRNEYAQSIRDMLGGYRFLGVSSYSRLEFKRAWVQRLALLHSICKRPKVTSLADVVQAILHAGSHPAQHRRLTTLFQAFEKFLRHGVARLPENVQVARLRAHAKNAALMSAAHLEDSLAGRYGEFKATECIRAQEPVREKRDGSLDATIRTCSPSKIQCRVHEFFRENATAFAGIVAAIESTEKPSAELRAMAEHIRISQENPEHLCDDKHCRKIADAIIAVDGKDMDDFAANNPSEWETISRAMGKTLVNPVQRRSAATAN